MLSIDTNILFYAYNADSPWHKAAYGWLASIQHDENVAISEFILAELYGLLRNPSVLKRPLNAHEAVEVIQIYRRHPHWKHIGFPVDSGSLHDILWQKASAKNFAFRRLYDTRSALSMTAQGVTDFATTNIKDFTDSGFARVWNPLEEQAGR